ncbi:MAG: glycosyltransferase [Candidatus Saccharibacteria bacterium]
MSKNNPRYSIVIPCYNEEKFIAKTLISLNKQTYDGTKEIIVVDNNCSDKTVEIAKSYGAKIVSESIPGVCHARQKGTLSAKGEIVISTDADTIYTPKWLQKIDNEFVKDPNLIAIAGPCKYRNGPWWATFYTTILFGSAYFYSKLTKHPYYLSATNFAFKKSAWEGYDVNLSQGGDEIAMIRQMKAKGKILFLIGNPTLTSARRLRRGMIYNIFITFIYYYLMGYHLNRIFKREVIKPAPAYREDEIIPSLFSRLKTLMTLPYAAIQWANSSLFSGDKEKK